MDAKALRLIYNIILHGGSQEDRRRAAGMLEREIRLKKLQPTFSEERNQQIYDDFMKDSNADRR